MPEKVWALLGGGDWADASVNFVILPKGVDIEKEDKNYKAWLHDVWWNKDLPASHKDWMNFQDWLIKRCGGREPRDCELETFFDY